MFHKFISIIILTTFTVQSTFAQNLPYTFKNEREQLDLDIFSQSLANLTEQQKNFFDALYTEPLQAIAELLLLLETLDIKTQNLTHANVNVEARVIRGSKKEEVFVELPGIGMAKFNHLGYDKSARVFTQVYVYRTNTIYNIIDLDIINPYEWDNARIERSPKKYLIPKEDGSYEEKWMRVVEKKDGTQELLNEGDFRVKKRYLSIWKESLKQQTAQLLTRTESHTQFIPIEQLLTSEEGTQQGTEEFIRQMIQTSASRSETQKLNNHHTRAEFGINTVNIFHKGSMIVRKDSYSKEENNSGVKSIQNYIRSIKSSPTAEWEHYDANGSLKTFNTGDFRTTWRSVIFQEILTIPLALYFTPDKFWASPLMVLIWGVVIGIYNKTYRNAINVARTPIEKNILVTMVSLSFNYTLGLILWGLQGLDPTTLEGFVNNGMLWLNVWISSWAKVKFQIIPSLREMNKLVPKELNINLGLPYLSFAGNKVEFKYYSLKKFKLGWGSSDEAQVASNLASSFKLADLIDNQPLFGPDELKLTISKLALISMGFIMHYAGMAMAYAKNLPARHSLREEWDRYHTLRKPFLTKEQQKTYNNFDEMALRYPGTNRKIKFPVAGYAQDVIEGTAFKTVKILIWSFKKVVASGKWSIDKTAIAVSQTKSYFSKKTVSPQFQCIGYFN